MSGREIKVTRRSLLKAALAGPAAGLALTGGEARAFDLLETPDYLPPEREVPTVCELCFWKCGVVAEARGNRVQALKGHPDYPNAQGKLCGRGNAGAGLAIDRDRLQYPMVRVGQRGEGRFERVGWKTAYQTIAEGFSRIKEKYGAEALALFYHGSGGTFLRTMMVAYGSPNFAGPAYAQCKAARNVGYKLTFGEKLSSPEPLDLDKTACMVFFGSHLGENAHNSQVQEFVRARARGAKLIVLDPRLSTPAARADIWMALKPGSDLAVLLAWIHLLLAEEAYDRSFVDRHCTGLEELRAHVKPHTPDWAAQEAGVAVEDIVSAYRMMRDAKPAVMIHPGRHVSWYGEADTQRARAQAILTALLGAWWAPGGIYRPEGPTLSDFPGPDFPDLPPHVDKAAHRFPFGQEVTTNGIRDATLTDKPYPIRGWYVHGTNLIQAMPNTGQTIEAINKLDMLVVCDIMPTEITQYADVLLPEDIYLERYDDLAVGVGKAPYIGLRQPVVRSPYDTRPAWRIAKELGTELGVGEHFGYTTIEEFLEARLSGSGVTLEELKVKGIHLTERKTPLYLGPDEEFHFHTPSGKVELYSPTMAEAGFDPLPVYKPLSDPPKGQLRLVYGRSPLHTFGRTQNIPILHDLAPENCLWLNPRCAGALGVSHGSRVMVRNDHGSETGPMHALVTERMPERLAYMVHGFGHRSRGLSRSCCQGGSDSDVIEDYAVDPISGSTGMRTQFITITPVGPGKEGKPCATV